MQFSRVCLENVSAILPEEVVTTAQIEERLGPLYRRLKLPEGRLELMSGIAERRFFPVGTRPSDISIRAAEKAIEASGINREHFGALIHGSVCRDFLEPATACRVHHALGLPQQCLAFDLSNACLGVLNGALQLAMMIDLGHIRAGIVVGSELGRPLVENTIEKLNADESLTRESVKLSVASLTIGSAGAAMVLCDESLSRDKSRLTSAAATAATDAHDLCQSEGLNQVMQTDSEQLMREGINAGAATFERFLSEAGWSTDDLDKTFCHQVGAAHRKMMLDRLGIDTEIDFATLQWLGNTGSAALPSAMATGIEQDWLKPGDRVGMLGIGSGVNCLMLGVEWQTALATAASQETQESRELV